MRNLNTISNWYGRLGNNIQQICNGILFSQSDKNGFFSPDHELINPIFFNCTQDDLNYLINSCRFYQYTYYENNYYYENKDFEIDIEFLYQNIRKIALEYITPNFKFKVKRSFGNTTLVIHLRSGDIFSQEHYPAHDYIPNPLSYYLNLIEKYEKVIVVTEPDNNNPILNELKKIKKVKIQSKSIEEDFATLLRAKNLASSGTGTFSLAAALCSKNIKNFYCSDNYLHSHLNPEMLMGTDISVHITRLNNYIPPRSWLNNKEQREFLINYNL
ncbi:MAG: hypothetical protein ACO25K_08270 [Candidatus Fonsibacter ubiquis]